RAAGTANRTQGEVARTVAALTRTHSQSLCHICIHNTTHPRRKLPQAKRTTLPLQPVAGHPAGSLQIECELAAEEGMRLQTSEQQVSVGYGGLRASPITDRAGIGAGGFRPGPQRPSCAESSH